MKTIDELYQEILASDELKAELSEAARGGKDTLLAFINDHDVELTAEEMEQVIAEKQKADQTELTDNELDLVAGGSFWTSIIRVVNSTFLFPGAC